MAPRAPAGILIQSRSLLGSIGKIVDKFAYWGQFRGNRPGV